MTDQTLEARVYRIVNSNRHREWPVIQNALRASFPKEMPEVLKILDKIIENEIVS